MTLFKKRAPVGLLLGLLSLTTVCGNNDGEENTGRSCTSAEGCYPDLPEPLKGGAAVCLDRVSGGYCTHTCQTDADCCAVEGECRGGHPQVCAPFESTGQMFCFLSCEAAIVDPTGKEEAAYCHEFAHESFGCRSTGGGAKNRKVCVPGG